MADRLCKYCADMGNCVWCSKDFEPTKVHSRCGRMWGDHERGTAGVVCPEAPRG